MTCGGGGGAGGGGTKIVRTSMRLGSQRSALGTFGTSAGFGEMKNRSSATPKPNANSATIKRRIRRVIRGPPICKVRDRREHDHVTATAPKLWLSPGRLSDYTQQAPFFQ